MRGLLHLAAAGAVVAAGVLAFVLALSNRPQQVAPPAAAVQQEVTVEELQRRPGLPVYWLGRAYAGLAIVKIQAVRDPGSPNGVRPAREYVRIIYASCLPGQPPNVGQGGQAEGYCAPGDYPNNIQVNSEWLCSRRPSHLARSAQEGPPVEIRGAVVQPTTSGNIRIHFARSTVSLFSSEGHEAGMQAFEDLLGVNPPGLAIAAKPGVQLAAPIPEEQCQDFSFPTAEPNPAETAEGGR